jgi:ADP-ribose pyrophosphatase
MQVFSGRRFDVTVEDVKLPNGHTMHMEKAHCPEVCHVVPIIGREVILLRQFRPIVKKWLYEIPAGLIDEGETSAEAAKRELEEETGFKAGKLIHLTTVFTSPGFTDELAHVFVAIDLKAGKQNLEPSENLRFFKLPIKKALKLIVSGRMNNSVGALALLLADKKLGLSKMPRRK